MWDLFHENVIENDQPHMDYNFCVYLLWYLVATRTKLKGQWAGANYVNIQSSDDDDTSYDLATWEGTVARLHPS
jgi:hypothetical protein